MIFHRLSGSLRQHASFFRLTFTKAVTLKTLLQPLHIGGRRPGSICTAAEHRHSGHQTQHTFFVGFSPSPCWSITYPLKSSLGMPSHNVQQYEMMSDAVRIPWPVACLTNLALYFLVSLDNNFWLCRCHGDIASDLALGSKFTLSFSGTASLS